VIYILKGDEVFLHIPDNNFIIIKLITFFKKAKKKDVLRNLEYIYSIRLKLKN